MADIRRIYGGHMANIRRTYGECSADIRRTYVEHMANIRRTYVKNCRVRTLKTFTAKRLTKIEFNFYNYCNQIKLSVVNNLCSSNNSYC